MYGEIQMATTTFSGPVNANNGFVAYSFNDASIIIADIDNVLNTTNKVAGLQAVDLDDGIIYTATGSAANAVWRGSDGTTTVTPA